MARRACGGGASATTTCSRIRDIAGVPVLASAPTTNRSTVLEMADATRAVSRHFGRPAGVVAHSLGAVGVAMAMSDVSAVTEYLARS